MENKKELLVKEEKLTLPKICEMKVADALQTEELKEILANIMYGSLEGRQSDMNKYISSILNVVRNNPNLLSCSTRSVLMSILTSANLQLPVDAKHYAYLVPYKGECSLIVGYQAYLYYAKKDPEVDNIEPFIVYECDKFDYYSDENGNHFTFKPDYSADRQKSKIKYGVAVLRYKQGTGKQPQIVVIPYDEILKLAPTFFSKTTKKEEQTKFWREHQEEMIKKTVVRRLGKWFLKDYDIEKLDTIDNGIYNKERIYYDEKGEVVSIKEKPEEKVIDVEQLENVVPLD